MTPVSVTLPAPDDFDTWRAEARRLVQAGIPPEYVVWQVAGDGEADLFGGSAPQPQLAPGPGPGQGAEPRVPRAFMALAGKAALHSDGARFALLYRVLWRLQRQPHLLDDATDRDVRRLDELARTVRRDMHKMRAFVRFRVVEEDDGAERYVAWFEPQHHILRANAAFFVNRFTTMRWSILTPAGALHWDGATLLEGPPAARGDAPSGDDVEDMWRTYYASTFNPARLKVGMMVKEMPRRYWRNLPEASLIPELIAGAQAREASMVERGAPLFTEAAPSDLAGIAAGIAACSRCAIGCNGTRAVAGEGNVKAALMMVGEQPGDNEERCGRPFVGPAGQLLDQHLAAAGIARGESYLTNAVKHFKYEPTGKRRLHQNPSAREIDICRWWIDAERAIIRPKTILALGASAARGILGRTVSVQQVRGQPMQLPDGSELRITVHPSYLLRLDGAARAAEEQRFAADLAAAAQAVAAG